jgi:hypothetical protein
MSKVQLQQSKEYLEFAYSKFSTLLNEVSAREKNSFKKDNEEFLNTVHLYFTELLGRKLVE